MLAFSSNRHGSYDVFVVPVQGGRPRRLTFDSATDMVCGWTPDGKNILFASTRSTTFPPSYELYTVPVEGGMTRRITAAEGKEGVFSPDGDRLAYVRGPGTWYRKGYRGSSNDDIWICNADGGHNRAADRLQRPGQLAHVGRRRQDLLLRQRDPRHPGQHRPPDAGQRLGVPRRRQAGRQARSRSPSTRTTASAGPASAPTASGSSTSAAPTCGSSPPARATPRKLAIEVNADDKANPEQLQVFTSGATEFALSADEKYIAFAVHGELFRMSVGPNAKAVQLTDGPSNDHGAAWAPDGSKIIFVSDRNGHEDLYLLEADDPEHPKLTEAHQFKVTQLTNTPEAEIGVSFSPERQARRLPPRRQAVDHEPRRQRCQGGRRRRSGLRLRMVAGRQVDRLRPPRRLLRQRAVHRPLQRRRRPTTRPATSPATPPTTAT